MSSKKGIADSHMVSVPSSLIDLLWEAEGESTVDASALEESRRIRDAAAALQQHLGRHRLVDGATEWSEVEIELPHVVQRHGSTVRREPEGPSARPGNVSSRNVGQRNPSPSREKASSVATRAGRQPPAREVIVRLLHLLATPDLQRTLAEKLTGRSLQREIVRLWFVQYRPFECEDLFSAGTASCLRSLSARMRQLLDRRELWSAPIEALLVDRDWCELQSSAESTLAQLSSGKQED